MKTLLKIIGILVVVVAVGVAGFFGYIYYSQSEGISEAASKIGTQADDFVVETMDGKQVKLSDYKGKTVFVNFWATWCPPCVGELPEFEAVYPEYKDKIQFLIVSTDTDKSKAVEFIKEKGYTMPFFWDNGKAASKVYSIQAIPTSILIGEDGKILNMHLGGMTKEQFLEFLSKAKK